MVDVREPRSAGDTGSRIVPGGDGDDEIEALEQDALEPVTLSVGDEVVHEQDGDEYDGDLEAVEGESHGVVTENPAEDDDERNNQLA